MLKLITLAIRHRFASNAPLGVTVLYDNTPGKKLAEDAPWIRFSVRPGASKPVTTGSKPLMEMVGRIEMSIFVPSSEGDAQALELADACESIFRDWRWQVDPHWLAVEGFERSIFPEEDWYQIKVTALTRARLRPA